MSGSNFNDDVMIRHYAVLYIDLLGQNEKLKRLKALPGNLSEREENETVSDTFAYRRVLFGNQINSSYTGISYEQV